MNAVLVLIALFILGSATVAISLRNLIHSALLLILSWFGTAAFYLWAGAEFVAFAQVLIYVGAISMVVLFAVLLTRRSHADLSVAPDAPNRVISALLAGGVAGAVLVGAVLTTQLEVAPSSLPVVTVRELGLQLMGPHTAALLVVGVLLTVALIGAVSLAATDRLESGTSPPDEPPSPEDAP